MPNKRQGRRKRHETFVSRLEWDEKCRMATHRAFRLLEMFWKEGDRVRVTVELIERKQVTRVRQGRRKVSR